MVRTLPSDVSPRLDASRILAISFAMAVHALALLVLLLPLTQAPLPELRKEPEPRWTVQPPTPVTPLPPQPVVQQPRVIPPRTPPAVFQRQLPVQQPAIVDQGLLQADPVSDTVGPPDVINPPYDGQPLQGAQLRYAVAPPPAYPRDAIRSNAQGTVMLRVLVDVDGKPLEVIVDRSSGHRSLDREAVRQVQQRWRFEPAMREGRAVQAWGLVPIDFSLQ
ncbi:energy transducer TonB [Pseudoxanthomonas daejeonensis]|uniref:energy transducer TonB n=1 Tax=Pseudoxanthomonas daejeonensis TaxID=266062 RepID=UPI001F546763|nr:energy transducer TonB [Pseudoxanthomonas daejeonensis]UNK57925.1 energy transducer TonB [Pseudoxanthomonas daejeonensis]